MQTWQIKALELEVSALKHLDGFIHDHALYFFIGVIYLLLALLVWVLSGALRRNGGKSTSYVQPVIFIDVSGPSQSHQNAFDPFPPPPHSTHYDCDNDDLE